MYFNLKSYSQIEKGVSNLEDVLIGIIILGVILWKAFKYSAKKNVKK